MTTTTRRNSRPAVARRNGGVATSEAATVTKEAAEVTPRLCGVNHLVLACKDMDRSLRFYCGILGMKVKCASGPSEEVWAKRNETPMADGRMRAHRRFYWLEMANGDVLALLEFPDFPSEAPPTYFAYLWPGKRPSNNKPGGMDHIAFNVNSLEEQKALRKRLVENNVPCSEITWSPGPTFVSSVWLYDPDGNAIEVATWNFNGPEWDGRTEKEWYTDAAPPPSFKQNFEQWRVPLSWHHTSHPTK